MKGITGLIVAIGLGIAAALLNLAYLAKTADRVEKIDFVAIKSDHAIGPGERLTEEHLGRVGIPKHSVGNLDKVAVLWNDRQTVVDQTVWRMLKGGSMLLNDDLKTPPQELQFSENLGEGVEERAMFVPIDVRQSVPRLVIPGRYVDFYASSPSRYLPTPDGPAEPNPASPAARPPGAADIIGPFRVLALGNRLGRPEVLRASKTAQVQENVMAVAVKLENKKLEAKALALLKLLDATGGRGVRILLHPPKNNQ